MQLKPLRIERALYFFIFFFPLLGNEIQLDLRKCFLAQVLHYATLILDAGQDALDLLLIRGTREFFYIRSVSAGPFTRFNPATSSAQTTRITSRLPVSPVSVYIYYIDTSRKCLGASIKEWRARSRRTKSGGSMTPVARLKGRRNVQTREKSMPPPLLLLLLRCLIRSDVMDDPIDPPPVWRWKKTLLPAEQTRSISSYTESEGG